MSLRLAFMGSPAFALPALGALLDAGHDVACVYSQLGQPDQAIKLLEKVLPYLDAVAARRAWLQHDSDLDPIRNDPRFQKLIETIGVRRAPTQA